MLVVLTWQAKGISIKLLIAFQFIVFAMLSI